MQIGWLQIRRRKDALWEIHKILTVFSSKLLVFQLAQEWQSLSFTLTFYSFAFLFVIFISLQFTWNMNSWGFFNSVHMLYFLIFSNCANCFARKRVKNVDATLVFHACVFARNSTPDFFIFLSVQKLWKANATFIFPSKNV